MVDTDTLPTTSTPSLRSILSIHLGILELADSQDERRLVSRVLHYLPTIRSSLDETTLANLVNIYFTANTTTNPTVTTAATTATTAAINTTNTASAAAINNSSSSSSLPVSYQSIRELFKHVKHTQTTAAATNGPACNLIRTYIWLLTTIWLFDSKQLDLAIKIASSAIETIQSFNNRLTDLILAKLNFYLFRSCELSNPTERSLGDIRNFLMIGLRLASLNHDIETRATIYNLILQSYCIVEQYDLADKFAKKSEYPAGSSSSQLARYHYYIARIHAIQTNYAQACDNLQHALRKASHGNKAAGFIQSVQKLLVVSQLLLGEIPERIIFSQPMLQTALKPYFYLTVAVRLGDLSRFQAVLTEYQTKFTADKTYSLILRLHQNVLKAGLKRLNLAYSRIPLSNVSEKLGLGSVEDAEFVIMKAIKDGIIDASLDYNLKAMVTKTMVNPYNTREPQIALHQRILQFQELYNDSIKAMRYPNGSKSMIGKSAIERAIISDTDLMEEYLDGDDDMDF